MAAKRINVELLIREIRFSIALPDSDRRARLLSATLWWPRPLIAQRHSVREISLSENRIDLSGEPWHQRILFKETLEGRLALGLSVSAALTDGELQKVMQALASPLLDRAGAGVDDLAAGGAWFAGLLAAPFAQALKTIATKRDPAILGAGRIDLDSRTILDASPFSVPLLAPNAITAASRVRRGDRIQTQRKTIAEKNAVVGLAIVDAIPV